MPILEEIFEAGDGSELVGYGDFWGVVEGVGDEYERMEDAFFVSDSGLGEVR